MNSMMIPHKSLDFLRFGPRILFSMLSLFGWVCMYVSYVIPRFGETASDQPSYKLIERERERERGRERERER